MPQISATFASVLGNANARRSAERDPEFPCPFDDVVDALLIAKAIDWRAPVKLQWTREDGMTGGYYRPMVVHKVTGVTKRTRLEHLQRREIMKVAGASVVLRTKDQPAVPFPIAAAQRYPQRAADFFAHTRRSAMTFVVAARTSAHRTAFEIVSIVPSIRMPWTTLPTTITTARDV
jgi:hypothetical protein